MPTSAIARYNHQNQPSMLHVSSTNIPCQWEMAYDKYSPLIYGMICKVTSDLSLAENILADAFLRLKTENILASTEFARNPVIAVLRHTYKCILRYFDANELPANLPVAAPGQFQMLWMICTNCQDLKTLSTTLGISESDARKKLFAEFNVLNTQDQTTVFAA